MNEQGYWYGIDGERHGPVPFHELQRLAAEGRLRPTDYVWNEEHQVWTRVSEFPGLGDAPGVPPRDETSGAGGFVGQEGYGRVHERPAWEDAPLEEHPIEYAGFWLRAGAFLIDQLALGVVGVIWGAIATATGMLDSWLALQQQDPAHVSITQLLESMPLTYYIVSTALAWLYFAAQEASPWQATLGKRAMGLIVVDREGGRCGFGTTSLRFLVKNFISPIFLLGFLMVLFNERKQALHDMVAGTFVEKL